MYSIDSRKINPHDIFIPIKGNNFDGHDFIPELLKQKIKIFDGNLQEMACYHRNNKIKATIIAITGSAGKTTLKDMLHFILSSKFKVHSTFENQNNEIGAPLTLLNAPDDTDYIIVEMGMRRRGDLKYLTNIIKPDVVFITNIGTAHLELMKSQRNIALGKAEIFCFPKQSNKTYKAFLNKETNFFETLKSLAVKNNFLVTTITETNTLKSNEALAKAFCLKNGFTNAEITNILKNFKPISSHRENIIEWQNNLIIDDTYNANPDSMDFAIHKAKQLYQDKKLITILGEMKELGKRESDFHQKLVAKIIKDNKIEKAFFYGNAYQQIEKITDKCYYYTNKSLISKKIKDLNLKNRVLLFKGSRSTKMETIIKELTGND